MDFPEIRLEASKIMTVMIDGGFPQPSFLSQVSEKTGDPIQKGLMDPFPASHA
jgi:hypothetical protein